METPDTYSNFTFFETYHTALQLLPTDEERLRYLMMVIEFGLYGKEPPKTDDVAYKLFSMNALHVIKHGRYIRGKNQRYRQRKREQKAEVE